MQFCARLLLVFLVPALALAHPDLAHPDHAATTFAQGVLHPLTGLDHILAMLAVGVWAAHLGRTASVALPIMFPVGMFLGVGLSLLGVVLPAVEPAIAISVIALGALIAARCNVHVLGASLLVACFAVFHGYAHANEVSGSLHITYVAGFIVATFALHLLGLCLGNALLKRLPATLPAAGSLVSIAGAILLVVGA